MVTKNSYESILTMLSKPEGGEFGKYFSLSVLDDPRIDRLPYSIRILLESAIRNCNGFQVMEKDVEKILDWENTMPKQVEIPFKPARVRLQAEALDLEKIVLQTVEESAEDWRIDDIKGLLGRCNFKADMLDRKVSLLSGREKAYGDVMLLNFLSKA